MLTNIKDPSVRYPVRAKRGFIQNYKQGNAVENCCSCGPGCRGDGQKNFVRRDYRRHALQQNIE